MCVRSYSHMVGDPGSSTEINVLAPATEEEMKSI